MDEHHEELAALNALHALDDSEQSAFEIELARNSELAKLTSELEATAAQLAATVPAVTPSPEIKQAVMKQIRARVVAKQAVVGKPTGSARLPLVAWGMAAAFAVGCFWQWNERKQLEQQVASMAEVEGEARRQLVAVLDERDSLGQKNQDSARLLAQLTGQLDALRQSSQLTQQQVTTLTREITELRKKDAFAQVQIATLQSTVAAYKEGVAVVVWDSEKHQGVLKLERMPPVEAGKDYQLWIVDPKNPTPVDAGIVQVDAQGFATVDFKPVNDVSEAAKFALSIEREGGVPKGEGPIILIGP